MLRIELEPDRVREIYGLGGGLGLAFSDVGEVAAGMLGERFGDRSGRFGSGMEEMTSRPYSSVKGRGGGRSTIASRSCESVTQSVILIKFYSLTNTYLFAQLLASIFAFHFFRSKKYLPFSENFTFLLHPYP